MICPTCALAADLSEYDIRQFTPRRIRVFHWLCEYTAGSCTCQHRVPGAEDLEPGMLGINEMDEAMTYLKEIKKAREEWANA